MSVVVAIESFITEVTGVPRGVSAGETFDSEHQIAQAHPGAFREFVVDNPVEAATAVPGEKRAVRRRTAKAEESGSAED